MELDTYLEKGPFGIDQKSKDAFFQEQMKSLTDHHRRTCRAYDDICSGLGQNGPYIPVALFKDLDLKSVEAEQVARQITSSGTTGQKVSRIYLDAATSDGQRRALCDITADFIGGDRIPMLIIDAPDVLRDRHKFTARGAGILGFAVMSSRRYYALNENMELDWESLEAFAQLSKEGPTFAFGFTFMIWAYFYKALMREKEKPAGEQHAVPDLSNCYLIHGGGWKKLQDQKVSDEEFQRGLTEACGITKISDYYGMAEQTGSIFMQCECGHLHASAYSDIEILDPDTFEPCEDGQWGLIALQSFLPKSYPGHKLLTEDWGRILGKDDCPCGRKGKYFEIQGRIQKAEVRGCSDTFEGAKAAVSGAGNMQAQEAGLSADGDLQVRAGAYPPAEQTRPAFDGLTMDFLESLSTLFMRDPLYRQYPDIYALGFWCRRAHLEQLKERQEEKASQSEVRQEEKGLGTGRGLVLHIAPSNMPTMFAYSWITGLLAGCSNTVRLSQKESEISERILQGIRQIMEQPGFEPIKQTNAFVQFSRDHHALQELSAKAAARIVWGGDETVKHICSIPKKEGSIDIAFPDKYSIALLDTSWVNGLADDELKHAAHLFFRDTYGADQNACSSPKTIFWLTGDAAGKDCEEACKDCGEACCDDAGNAAKARWWNAVAAEAEHYDLQPWMATEKYRQLCCMYAQKQGLGQVQTWKNRLYVVPCDAAKIDGPLWDLEARMGLFYELDIRTMDELYPFLEGKIQTIVRSGDDQKTIYDQIRQAGCEGVDRVVSLGEALDFDTIWDRKDMIHILTEER